MSWVLSLFAFCNFFGVECRSKEIEPILKKRVAQFSIFKSEISFFRVRFTLKVLENTSLEIFVNLKYVLLSAAYGTYVCLIESETSYIYTRVPGNRCTSLFDVVAVVSQVWNG